MYNGAFLSAVAAREFILAGVAVFTIVSEATDERYTFKVEKSDRGVWFVKYQIGPDNNAHYTYLGMIKGDVFKLTRQSKNNFYSTPFRAFQYMWQRLVRDEIAPKLQIWHVGRCGRCGRPLTVPQSIERGFGPECQEILDRTHLQVP